MDKGTLQNEINLLRAQIDQLTTLKNDKKTSEINQEQSPLNPTEDKSLSASEEETPIMIEDENIVTLEQQFQTLIETINTELKDASPVTVLAVFAAGVLAGRLLPK
jgi:hypothetical protein